MQQRVVFAIATVPIAAGMLGTTTRGMSTMRRTGRFFAVAVLLAAVFISSPFDPRIPHTEHMAFTLYGFVIPLVGTGGALSACGRWLAVRGVEESHVAVAALGAVLACLLFLSAAIFAGETGRLLFDALSSS